MTEQLDPTQNRPRLTVGILTLNEEKRIASCINSAKFADQIVVIDSYAALKYDGLNLSKMVSRG